MFKEIYKKIFPGWIRLLKKESTGCGSVLDLACGYNSLIQYTDIPNKVGVEMFSDYINESKKKHIHNEYVQEDILKVKFPPKSYDLVLCSEAIEHLDKNAGFALLDKMELWARKKVIITTPNGFVQQVGYDSNPLQAHKSGWSAKEFRDSGYVVHGIAGLKIFKGEEGKIKYHPYFFWKIVSDISQCLAYFLPEMAFQLFAIKKINNG